MKSKIKYLLLVSIATLQANATVTMSFNSNALGALSNFLNGAGTGTTAMAWGIVVDTAGNGFAGNSALTPYDGGFNMAATGTGTPITLSVSTVATDDRLFMAPGFMSVNTAITDGNAIGVNKLLSMTSLTLGAAGVAGGQSYAIIWFDSLTRPSSTSTGTKYGVYVPPAFNLSATSGLTTADKLPTNDGATYSYGPAFLGADSAKSMGFTIGTPIPETSTSLLGAIGALALLRRRRN